MTVNTDKKPEQEGEQKSDSRAGNMQIAAESALVVNAHDFSGRG
jgi:hypothetical protein